MHHDNAHHPHGHHCCCPPAVHVVAPAHVVVVHQHVVVKATGVSDTPSRRAARRNRHTIAALAGH